MATSVSLVKCQSYDQAEVEPALHQALSFLGGIEAFVKPGQKVLIKPNVLMGSFPEAAVTTHPAIISAVVKEVLRAGGIAMVGDSPGNAYTNVAATMEKTGILKAVEQSGGKMVYFQEEGIEEIKSPSQNKKLNLLPIAKAVLEADVIINLPKLKTHTLTLYTGAIKNMFGSVPGFNKTRFHIKNPDPYAFAQGIVDVFQITKPALNIMDGILGMEGQGPSNGNPRHFGALAASANAVALDAVCSYLIGYQSDQIDTSVIANQRKLGMIDLEKIEIIGETLISLRQTDWKHPASGRLLAKFLPKALYSLIANQLKINPVINQKKCTQCLVCYRNCPAKTIKTHPPVKDKVNHPPSLYKRGGKEGGEFIVKIDLKNCINCFCCHELCKYDAVLLQKSWLAKLLRL